MLRSDKVYECVKKYTENLLKSGLIDSEGADAEYVADQTKIERSNVSRELNQLWKRGKLIKFQGRPVFFMDYVTIKMEYPSQYIPLLIPYNKKLSFYLEEEKANTVIKAQSNPLERIIGATNGSLSKIVDDVISSISYRTHSLPVLIKGEKGLRKRSFVSSIFDYARANGIKPEDSRLIMINCQEFVDNGDRFLKRIFGQEDEKGAFELANKGIIFLQNIHYLPFSLITPVTDALVFGYYSKAGEIRRRKLDVSVIASINESASKEQQDFYNSIFPMVVELPSFNKRNIYEKIETILSSFTDEAVSLNIGIILNKSVLSIFLQHHYDENERQLINYIRITCANALAHQNSKLENVLHISIDSLPLDLLSSRSDFTDDAFYISALDLFEKDYLLCESNGHCESFEFFKTIQDRYNEKNLTDFSKQFYLDEKRIEGLDRYLDESIEAVLHCDNAHYHKLRSSVDNQVKLVFLKEIFADPHYSRINENNRVLYAVMATVSNYLHDRPELPNPFLDDDGSAEYASARHICEKLSVLNGSLMKYICLYLKKTLSYFSKAKSGILLVARGESIASQYKDLSLNYAQEKSIRIEAIDYRSSLQYNDILELIYNKITYLGNDSEVVVITDSVPLTDIEDNIREKTGIKCKVISPLSYDMIIRCIDELSKSVSLDTLCLGTKKIANSDHNKVSEEEFINRLTDDVLSKTLTHINPHKAVDALLVSLNEICDELKISKSRDVIVKYLSHGVHMLERVIKHQPLNYYQLNKFSAENHNLMDIIAKSLSSAENIFDLSVPTCEIAYLAEIFLEGVE